MQSKAAARVIRANPQLRQRRRTQLKDEKVALAVITAAHLQVLARRDRVAGEQRAQKTRTRKEPALPRIAGPRAVRPRHSGVSAGELDFYMWAQPVCYIEGFNKVVVMDGPVGQSQHCVITAAGNLRWL